ncbi:MAG: Helicase associated domain protein [Porticoccaceae bacterium]
MANQLAIKECIDKYKVKKIFSFHKSIKSAKSFVALDNQGIGNHIDFLSTYHVNGRIQAGRREKIIREFKSSDYALLSNARCLTEGVDVPAVDMVAFMSPKRSRVDVIQATGRAMRKSGSKEVGYVLVPIYLELQTGESISDAINETDFGEVFDVLNALQEQDQELHNAICYLREQMPLAKGFRDDRFERRVKMISKSLKLDDLKASITTKIVRKLAPVWHERFAQLKNYYEEHGNSNVPSTWEKDPRLSNWVKTQRQQYQLGILTEDKIKKLESIDFSWSIVQFAWNENYKKLKDYFISFGNSAIKKDYDESLYNWVCTQRKNNEDGLLSDLKVELLNELDFSWERSTAGKDWDSRFEEVKQFFDSTGGFPNAREPIIGMWCVFQREKFRSGDLSVYKINKLDSIEFNWEPRQDNWDAKYKELCVFQKKYGHTRVSPRSSEYKKLSAWVISQRQKYPTYLESDNQKIIERVNLLNNIGFDWRTRSVEEEDNRFLEMLDQLQLFYTKHGHFHVPVGDQAYTDLGIWLRNQKSYHRRGNLVDYKKELMEEIGFSFERNDVLPEEHQADHGKKKQIGKPRTNKEKRTVEHVSDFRQEIFKNSFEKLVAYKARFGHTRVPARWEEDVPLGRWVERQRILFRKNKLPEIHQQMLDEIEFNYNVRESRKAKSASQKYSFDERLSQVENYKARFGTANVPIRCGQQGLGQWISRQRKKYKKGTLPQAEQQQLASLGVKFGENWYSEQGTEQLETTERKSAFSDWLLRYAELQDFYLKFGHSNVTLNHSADKSLHYWVRRQRLHYSQGRLSDEQIQQLESLNFAFRLRPEFVSWDQRVEQLEAFKAKFGHVEVTREQDHDEGLAKWLKSQVSQVAGLGKSMKEEK